MILFYRGITMFLFSLNLKDSKLVFFSRYTRALLNID